MQDLLDRPGIESDAQMLFCFALGRAQANAGDYEHAFAAYLEGNRRKRQTFDYDPKESEHHFAAIAEVFCGDLPALSSPSPATPRPLFIVVMRRDPLDVCLSCFEQVFKGHHPYAYDLEELGRYYLAYERLMAFWQGRLPERIHELDYAQLVSAPQTAVGPVLEALGLEWDDACLRFHENSAVVMTASVVQVRRPLYRSSIGRWRRYERQLAPLIELLGQEVPRSAS